ncbi:MAG TPA: hypothetical protein VFU15_13035 [Bacteroidia bacterium]|nr:hypothetical protein [Bacteroidia bacterium]
MHLRRLIAFTFFFFSAFVLSANGNDTSYIYVHILHGSKPQRNCPDDSDAYYMLGGKLGGHVVIQLDSFDYGFSYTTKHVHPFARKKKSCCAGVYECDSASCQLEGWSRDKVTTIKIPVSPAVKKQLRDSMVKWHQHPPFDYAFFGMRCASTAYYLLSIAGVFPKASKAKSMRKAFWPGAFRKKIMHVARKKHYAVTVHPGSRFRRWEGG